MDKKQDGWMVAQFVMAIVMVSAPTLARVGVVLVVAHFILKHW